MKEITLDTKIADLLENYEGMKDILIAINPKFKKLNNPILRRTVAKIAGVKQAAIVGGMDPIDLLNQIRKAVGQAPVENQATQEEHQSTEAPQWILQTPSAQLNANEILDNNGNPLTELNKTLKKLEKGEVVLLSADFQPEPLVEAIQKVGYETYTQKISDEEFVTYIRK